MPNTEDDSNYNGWCNYATWKVATTLLNQEDYYAELMDCSDVDDIQALCIENKINTDNVYLDEILEATRD